MIQLPTSGVSTHPTPLTYGQRLVHYQRQAEFTERLTARQMRRLRHKENRASTRGTT